MIEEFLYVFRVAFVLTVLVVIVFLTLNLRVLIQTGEIERFSAELAENMLTSHLVDGRAAFNANELAKYDGTTAEPYHRQCKYAYFLEIEAIQGEQKCTTDKLEECKNFCNAVCGIELDNIKMGSSGNCDCVSRLAGLVRPGIAGHTCQCKKGDEWRNKYKWSFGYQFAWSYVAQTSAGSFSETIETSTYTTNYDVVVNAAEPMAAKMTLTVYDNWQTRISCLVETAWARKQIESMEVPCITTDIFNSKGQRINPEGSPVKSLGECGIALGKDNGNLCLFSFADVSVNVQGSGPVLQTTVSYLDVCRSLSAPVELFYYPYSTDGRTRTIKAIPVKKDYADEIHKMLLAASGPDDLRQKMLEVCKKAANYKLTDPTSERAGTILLCMAA